MSKAKILEELAKRAESGADKIALQFIHNTRAENIGRYQDIGGLPMPSIAVTKENLPFDSFGDISLIGKPSSFDPKANRANKAYSADAYTARAPSPVRVASKKAGKRFQNELEDKLKSLGSYTSETASNIWDLEKKGDVSENTYNQVQRFFDNDKGVDALFLESKGIELPRKSNATINGEPLADYVGADIANRVAKGENLDDVLKAKREDYEDILDTPDQRDVVLKKANREIERLDAIESVLPDGDIVLEAGEIDSWKANELAKEMASERAAFGQDLMNQYFDADEYFIANPDRDYYTQRARLKPYQADEMTKFMKKQDGEGGLASKSAGALRASTVEPLKSLQGMRDIKDRLVSADDMAEFKQTSQMMLDDLQDAFKPYYKYSADGWQYSDEFNEFVKMSEQVGIERAAKEFGFDVPDGLRQELNEYKDMLRAGQTEYFESKPERVVDLSEFGGAVVPTGTPQNTLDILKKNNVPYETYDPNVEGSRLAARNKFSDYSFDLGAGLAATGGIASMLPSDRATGTVTASRYPVLGDIATALRKVETPIGYPFGGLADYLNKVEFNEERGFFDRLGAIPDPFEFSKILE